MGKEGTEGIPYTTVAWIELKMGKLWLYSVRCTEEGITTAFKKVNFVQEACVTFSGESELDFKKDP